MIRVDASLYAARHGYHFVDTIDYDDWVENGCSEGHRLKTAYIFANDAGDEIHLGGTCQDKYILFKLWKNLDVTSITPALTSIGEKFWLIERDGLWDIVNEIIARKKITIDFKTIPGPDEIEAYKKTVSELHSQAFAIMKAREKEEAERLAMSEKTLGFMTDKDYASIVKISLPWNNDLETKRKDLLHKFEKWGWNENQRRLVRFIAMEYKRHGSCEAMSIDDKTKLNTILAIVHGINTTMPIDPFILDFTNSIIRQQASLTDKQIPIAVRIILQYLERTGIKIDFNIKDFLIKIKRKS